MPLQVSIVDNGIDTLHEDLINNIGVGNYSYLPKNYNFNDADHGTSCAGIIAGEEGNGLGISGIAPKAKIIGFNALRVPSISNLADALVRHKERVWVSSNSWGDFNSWGEPLALRSLIRLALEEGIKYGRGGKGIIYVFAAGNGESKQNNLPTDNVNYSGLVNNRYTIPVCAVDENGIKTDYSETGATLIVCAPSKGRSLGITTTDVSGKKGYNPDIFPNDYDNKNYTENFGGTSASAPMVSGVVALILEANPNLNWRDVRVILAESAKVIDSQHLDWKINGAGIDINHSYGFGLVNADNAITLAKKWTNFSDEIILEKELIVDKIIPNNEEGITSDLLINNKDLIVEFVDLFFDSPDHPKLGDLEIKLISPGGTVSILAEQHSEIFEGAFRYKNWRFGSMRYLNENAYGIWKLIVKDKGGYSRGILKSLKLKIYGHKL